jgi:hypothetical protein
MKKIKVKVEKTATGFSAYAEKYDAFTTGKTIVDLTVNMVDSLNLYFKEAKIKQKVSAANINFELEVTSVFDVFPINVKALADRIGMNYTLLSQYATGRKTPSPKQTEKIVEGIQEVGRELAELSLV